VAGTSLLALIDDIATVLDDVAVLTKVAAKKTAGVLGDDLALNAQRVAGVNADRELPVVWAVAKGSAINKLILVPVALAISQFAPWAVTPLLMFGGLFLCFEGVEKLAHKFLHKDEEASDKAQLREALLDSSVDLVAFEKDKIKGAVRTDFVLSAEIIAITLGAVTDAPFVTRLVVLIGISALITVGVYGFVAGIVKIDDAGLYLNGKSGGGELLGMIAGEADQIAAAPGNEELRAGILQQARQLADDRVVLLAHRHLHPHERLHSDDVAARGIGVVPEAVERGTGEPRRARDEVGSQAHAVAPVLEVRAPAASEPPDVERRAEPVAGCALGEDVQHVPCRFLVLSQDPVAILAHDGEPMEHHGLAGTDQRPAPAAIECLRQLQIGVGCGCHHVTIASVACHNAASRSPCPIWKLHALCWLARPRGQREPAG
jgi:predicted DNA repair protein MutK